MDKFIEILKIILSWPVVVFFLFILLFLKFKDEIKQILKTISEIKYKDLVITLRKENLELKESNKNILTMFMHFFLANKAKNMNDNEKYEYHNKKFNEYLNKSADYSFNLNGKVDWGINELKADIDKNI